MAAAPAFWTGISLHPAQASPHGSTSVVVVILAIAIQLAGIYLIARCLRHREPGDDDEDSGGSGGGGGGSHRKPPRQPIGPDGEPEWWPEFERAFAAHVQDRLSRKP